MSADAFIAWGAQTAVAVTLLVGLILIIRRPFSRYFGPKAAYALWALPVLRIFMPPLELAWLAPVKAALPPQPPQVIGSFAPQDLFHTVQTAPSQLGSTFWASYGISTLFIIWAVGVVAFIVWQFMAQRKTLNHWLLDAQTPSCALIKMNKTIAHSLEVTSLPTLSLSANISGPLVTGLRRPHILLPLDFAESFTPDEQYYALLHEMTHIKRRDLYTSLLALFVRALNWPNPLVHIAARYFRADQEAACDASVLTSMSPESSAVTPHSHAYAQTLIKAAVKAQDQMPSGFTAPALALTIHHPLKERLMTLSNPMPKPSLRHRLAATAIAATVLTLNAPISFVAASEAPQTELAGEATPPAPPTPPHVAIVKEFRTIDDGTQTHVIHSRSDKNGVVQDRKVEINVDGDTVTAYEIDPVSGVKAQINPETIEGYERITQGSGRFKIDSENGQVIRFEELDGEINEIITELQAEGKLDEGGAHKRIKILRLENSDSNDWVDSGDGTTVMKGAMTFKFDGNDLPDGVDIETLLKDQNINIDLDGLKQIKVLKSGDAQVFFSESDISDITTSARLQAAESMLESVKSMLDEDGDASRELKKARKALQDATKALEKARAKIDQEK